MPCNATTEPYFTHRRVGFMVASVLATSLAVTGLGGCGLAESEPEPSDALLVVLADLTPSGLLEEAAQRRHITDVVVPLAIAHDAEVVLAAIDDAALVDPEPRGGADFDRAAAQGNDVLAEKLLDDARAELARDVDDLFASAAGRSSRGSDVAGAVAWAAGTLGDTRDAGGAGGSGGEVQAAGAGGGAGGGDSVWRGLAVLSDAISTIPPCTMTRPPLADVEAAITSCFAGRVPDLTGTDAYFLGAGVMPGGEPTPVDVGLLEAFWTAVVERGGGSLQAFGPTVLGPTTDT